MSEYIINASTPEFEREEDIFKKQDPFNKPWEEIKALSGLDSNFKRRATRLAKNYNYVASFNYFGPPSGEPSTSYLSSSKAVPAGIDGAGSKEINPGTVYRNG